MLEAQGFHQACLPVTWRAVCISSFTKLSPPWLNGVSAENPRSLEPGSGGPFVKLVVVVVVTRGGLGHQGNRLRSPATLGAGAGGGALHYRTVAQLAGTRRKGEIHLLTHLVSRYCLFSVFRYFRCLWCVWRNHR